jgi:hypothetical protein
MVWSLNPGTGKRFFSSPKRPDQLWCPPNLLFNGYHIVPRLRMNGAVALLPLHAMDREIFSLVTDELPSPVRLFHAMYLDLVAM